ncbi:DNA-binding response regulator [Paenibacillus sp. 598K]|uniref:response regulator transcription factor n=1 Tax=Paenibacillus sp. 598K TaxID=1117987 RepID=UPI000FF9577A|nr:response regulator transcription factor [Paenibacillus sp. 598K]GBF77231.1 DNA-binding response regulator [Paenibacillus sp. 598K]
MTRILYIEDDRDIGSWTSGDLEKRGYEVTWRTSGEHAGELAREADLVILDVMLPGLDGFTIGQRLKNQQPDLPILVLSARTAVDDKLQGLNFADDYMTKPFHPEELAARIQVLLRRGPQRDEQTLTLEHLRVLLPGGQITDTLTGEEILLSGKQFQIFMYLLRHHGRVLTKEQIYEAVWGEPYLDGDKTLNVHIRYLREKIEVDPSQPAIIQTVRGIGFRVKP